MTEHGEECIIAHFLRTGGNSKARPGARKAHGELNSEPASEERVQLLCERYECGKDLFTGKPLQGAALRAWFALQKKETA